MQQLFSVGLGCFHTEQLLDLKVITPKSYISPYIVCKVEIAFGSLPVFGPDRVLA